MIPYQYARKLVQLGEIISTLDANSLVDPNFVLVINLSIETRLQICDNRYQDNLKKISQRGEVDRHALTGDTKTDSKWQTLPVEGRGFFCRKTSRQNKIYDTPISSNDKIFLLPKTEPRTTTE